MKILIEWAEQVQNKDGITIQKLKFPHRKVAWEVVVPTKRGPYSVMRLEPQGDGERILVSPYSHSVRFRPNQRALMMECMTDIYVRFSLGYYPVKPTFPMLNTIGVPEYLFPIGEDNHPCIIRGKFGLWLNTDHNGEIISMKTRKAIENFEDQYGIIPGKRNVT